MTYFTSSALPHVADAKQFKDIFLYNIIKDTLVFYGQDIVKDGEVLYTELLARFEHKGRIFTPYESLGNFDEEMIYYLTILALENVAILQKENPRRAYGINVSPDMMSGKEANNFIMKIVAMFNTKLIDPNRLFVELTENGSFGSMNEEAIRNLKGLKLRGVKLALDDFGTHTSNFNHIIEEQLFDLVKVDGAFVQGILSEPTKAKTLKMLIDILKHCGYQVVVEHVSNQKVLTLVKGFKPDYYQGYYFGEPRKMLPVETGCVEAEQSRATA